MKQQEEIEAIVEKKLAEKEQRKLVKFTPNNGIATKEKLINKMFKTKITSLPKEISKKYEQL